MDLQVMSTLPSSHRQDPTCLLSALRCPRDCPGNLSGQHRIYFYFFSNKSNYFPVNLDAAGSSSLLSSAFRQGAAGCCWLVPLPTCSQRLWTSSQLEVGKKILQVSTVLPLVRFSRVSPLLRASLHHGTWARMGPQDHGARVCYPSRTRLRGWLGFHLEHVGGNRVRSSRSSYFCM